MRWNDPIKVRIVNWRGYPPKLSEEACKSIAQLLIRDSERRWNKMTDEQKLAKLEEIRKARDEGKERNA